MKWTEIRSHYPSQWLVVEAVQARSELGKRELEELSVLDAFSESQDALKSYLDLHRRVPERELYILHTDRETIDIAERTWLGLRAAG